MTPLRLQLQFGRALLAALALVLACAAAVSAAPISLVKQFNTGTADSAPSAVVEMGGAGYFFASTTVAYDARDERDTLVRTDGTAAGTLAVKHFSGARRRPDHLTAIGNTLFFTLGSTTRYGDDLWLSDGTSEGTRQVALPDGAVRVAGTHGGALYVYLTGGTTTPLFRVSPDGTASQTVALPGSVGTAAVTPSGGVYFNVQSAETGALWVVDADGGAPTKLRDDFRLGPWSFTLVGERAYFSANADEAPGKGTWTSDGTAGGTEPVGGVATYGYLLRPLAADDALYGTDSAGEALFRFRGADATKVPIPGDLGGPQVLAVYGGSVYFTAGPAGERSLWRTRGDALPLRVSPTGEDAPPGGVLNVGATASAVFFIDGEAALWTSDGTVGGTRRISRIVGQPYDDGPAWPLYVGEAAGQTLFASATAAAGLELWRTDGTAAGTGLVKDLNRQGLDGRVGAAASHAGYIYFGAGTNRQTGLWRSDGTAAGTNAVYEMPDGDVVDNVVLAGSQLAFRSFGLHGLWWSDGSPNGTRAVLPSAWNEGAPFYADDLVAFGDRVVFTGPSETTGSALWISDGTPGGTRSIVDLQRASEDDWTDAKPVVAGGRVYFTAWDPAHGEELWSTDGTPGGTGLLRDASPGPHNSRLEYSEVGGRLVWVDGEQRIWSTDGTASGTRQISGRVGYVHRLIEGPGGAPYLSTTNEQGGPQLWRVGPRGAELLTNGTQYGSPQDLVRFGDRVLYSEHGLSPGGETKPGGAIWITDGTPAGTRMVKQFADQELVGNDLTAAGRHVYFTARGAATGVELWRTDGTAAGTQLVEDLWPGADSAFPQGLVVVRSRLLFTAAQPLLGRQLFGLDLPPAVGGPSDPGTAGPAPVVKVSPKRLTLRVSTARDRRAPYRYTFSGSLTMPPGVSVTNGCGGFVEVRVKRGSRVVLKRTARLRVSKTRCEYRLKVTVPRSRVARRGGKLRAAATFNGTELLSLKVAKSLWLRYGR